MDLLGYARFGYRPLAGLEKRYKKETVLNTDSNHHIAHEQLWFDDNKKENIGFFSGNGDGFGPAICGEKGNVRSDQGYSREDYDFFGPTYDDSLMRRALKNINNEWESGRYCVVGNNCQHFAEALRNEYERIGAEN